MLVPATNVRRVTLRGEGRQGRGGEREAYAQEAQHAVEGDDAPNRDERPTPHHRHPDQKKRVQYPHVSFILGEVLVYVGERREPEL